jgi:hypothetical protein
MYAPTDDPAAAFAALMDRPCSIRACRSEPLPEGQVDRVLVQAL